MRKNNFYKKILTSLLVGSMVLTNIIPSFAYTYKDSTASEEYHNIEINTEASNTTVYAEVGSAFKVTIPKHIVLDGANKTGAYKVAVTGDIAGTETISVIPDKSFDLSSTNLEDVTATINQNKISWKYNEILENSSILGNGTIDASDITAGSWNGNFNFNISLKNNLISVESTDENGNNLNATAENIVNEEKAFLLEELDKSGLANSDEIDAIVEVESDDFENLAKTVFDVSDIAKPGDKVIVLHFNEETNEWEYISTETVADDGTITVYMDSYSPVAFVKVENNIPEHIHNYAKTTKESTCTEKGEEAYVCSCGDEYITTIEALGHDYKATVTDATCTEKGYTTWRCSRCEDTYTDSEAQALGHSFGEWTIIENANCVDKGSKERICSICNYKETENINTLGHSWNEDYTIDKEATCTTDGSKSIHCTECNATKDSTVIPALGHNSVAGGTKEIHTKCSICNTTLSIEHNLVETVTKKATCTEKGKTKYSCECGYNYELENIEALGHDYKQTVTNPTCTNTGYTTNTCSRCNDTYKSNEVVATGHDYNLTITEATCTVDGNKHYECKNCDSKYDEVISAKGHIYTANNYVTDKAATCTEAGQKSVHCNVCRAIITNTVTIVPATGHTEVNGGTDSIHTKCLTCNIILSVKHNYKSTITKEATCTTTGVKTYTCDCGYKYTETIPALEHNYINGICSCGDIKSGTTYKYTYTGSIQTFTAPASGTYKLNLNGAQGSSTYATGGLGAFASGEIHLEKGEQIYITVGGAGNGYTAGFNGGSAGSNYINWWHVGGGGGATDIRKGGTAISNRIIVAAGGGGGVYTTQGAVLKGTGGNGNAGTFLPVNVANTSNGSFVNIVSSNTLSNVYYNTATLHTASGTGGGGGYYGGRTIPSSANVPAGEGGTSYIGGVQNGTMNAGQNTGNGNAQIIYIGK